MAAPNNDTLTALVASLAQLNIALQAHLTATQATPNTTTAPSLPTDLLSHETQPTPTPNETVPTARISRTSNNPLSPPPIDISDDEDDVVANVDPLNPSTIVALLDGIESDVWYVVTVGLTPGIYTDWLITAPEVLRVQEACFKKARSKSDAIRDYTLAWNKGKVRRVERLDA